MKMPTLQLPDWKKFNLVLKVLKVFYTSSWISIWMVLAIFLLLTKMAQGPTIVIELLSDPINLLIFYGLGTGFVLIISHYPIYIYKWKRNNNLFLDEVDFKGLDWKMEFQWLGLGLISYNTLGKNPQSDKIIYANVRKAWTGLSIVTIFSGIYVLLFCYKNYIDPNFDLWLWVFVICFLILLLISSISSLKKYTQVRIFSYCFWIGIVGIVFNVVISMAKGWSPYILIGQLSLLILGAVSIYLFRSVRFIAKEHKGHFPLHLFSNNKNYLFLFFGFGILAMAIFVLSQIIPTYFSPINIILAFLITLYGLIMIPLKHRFFYLVNQNDNPSGLYKFWRFFFPYVSPLLSVLFIAAVIYMGARGNNLHLLPQIDEKPGTTLDEQSFIRLLGHQNNTADSSLYFIASYGGGLKANAWTMMVLDSLARSQDQNILERTVAFSGISGGALGLSFYTSLQSGNITGAQLPTIKKIASSNYLSNDIAWMMGWDFIRELDPITTTFKVDRAKNSLKQYASALRDQAMLDNTYRAHWKSIFDHKGFWPVLITSSAGTQIKRGVACSIELKNFEDAFPDAIDLLTFPGTNKSLSFADAVSCSNRFPIVSPSARIDGKGYFLDGGYYENSGMLSLKDFYNYLNRDTTFQKAFGKHKMKFIQITNAKSDHIKNLLDKWFDNQLITYGEDGELLSVVASGTTIDFLPPYLAKQIDAASNQTLSYHRISLPAKLTKDDVFEYFNIRSLSTAAEEELVNILNKNNERIDDIFLAAGYTSHWDLTEPSTARLLGPRSVSYMEAMIKYGDVFKDL